jgi:hypothetical protein
MKAPAALWRVAGGWWRGLESQKEKVASNKSFVARILSCLNGFSFHISCGRGW